MALKGSVADFLRILAVFLITWQLGARWHTSRELGAPTASARRPVEVARRDLLADSAHGTLVIVTASYCHFCRDSIPFYRSLFPLVRQRSMRIVAVTPEDPQVNESYLSANGLKLDAVLSARDVGMVVEGTPSLLLLKAGGPVAGSWVGRLREREQKEVIREAMRLAAFGVATGGRK